MLTEEEIRQLELHLVDNPRAGVILTETGGVRKVRAANEGRGKSGSARVAYLYVELREKIYLLLAFPKNEQANLTAEQKKQVRKLVEMLKNEG